MNFLQKSAFAQLRLKAEAILKSHPAESQNQFLNQQDFQQLIHECELSQLELEVQNEELNQAVVKANIAIAQLTDLYDFSPVIYFSLNSVGELLKVNFSAAKALGEVRSTLVLSNFADFVAEESRPIFHSFLASAFSTKLDQHCEISLKVADKSPQFLYLSGIVSADLVFDVTAVDITERRQRENYAELSRNILQVLGEDDTFQLAMQRICKLVMSHADVDAVGIRFQQGDDYPYIASEGFSDDFLTMENSLRSCSNSKGLCETTFGKPQLDCTCGMMISGTYNPNDQSITKAGSLVVNDTLPFLSLDAEADPRSHPRNECIHQGYTALTLIPIRAKLQVMGLLQLNAKTKNKFSKEAVEMLEIIADNIGEAFLRKQVELELAESAEKYLLLFANNPQPSWIFDAQTLAFLEVNQAAVRHYGFSEAEFLGMTILEIRCKDEIPYLMQLLSASEEQSPIIQNVKHRKKNGEEMIVDITVHKLLLKGRKVYHIVISDITERIASEKALLEAKQELKQQNRLLTTLIDNITDGVFTCQEGMLVQVNQTLCAVFGYSSVELLGMELLQMISAENSLALEVFLYSNHLENESFQIELICAKKDQSPIYVDFRLNYEVTKNVIYGIAHDITEKKQIQKKSMVKAIIQTEEREKAHFSKELHDGIGPLLSTIKLYLQWLDKSNDNHAREEILLKTGQVLEDAITSVKEISYKLSPHLLTNHGLTSAIQGFANKLAVTNAIVINCNSNLTQRLDMEIEVACYRVLIECINNTLKYANATTIGITIQLTDNHLQLVYRDDGEGFNLSKALSEQKGLGLFNLQNRIQTIGGILDMISEPGGGVYYTIQIDL